MNTKEEKRAYLRKYNAENKERIRSRSKAYHQEYYKLNKERFRASSRAWNYKAKYGITVVEWEAMFSRQDQKCAACGTLDPGPRGVWHTDHCHTSGKVRGILCRTCNQALGMASDSPSVLRSLADYLERNG